MGGIRVDGTKGVAAFVDIAGCGGWLPVFGDADLRIFDVVYNGHGHGVILGLAPVYSSAMASLIN